VSCQIKQRTERYRGGIGFDRPLPGGISAFTNLKKTRLGTYAAAPLPPRYMVTRAPSPHLAAHSRLEADSVPLVSPNNPIKTLN